MYQPFLPPPNPLAIGEPNRERRKDWLQVGTNSYLMIVHESCGAQNKNGRQRAMPWQHQ